MVFGKQLPQGSESNRWHADGVRVENISWNHNVGPPREDFSIMRELQFEPEHFNDRIIFMLKYNDIEWGENGNTEKCETNSVTVANCARRFPLSNLDQRSNVTELIRINQTENGQDC